MVASVTSWGVAMSGRKVAPVVFASVFAVVCAGCSGGDEATLPSAAAPSSTTTPASIESASTIAATVAPTTLQTTSPPITTPATDPTTSTTAPLTEQQAEQAVIEAAIASWTALNEALLDPSDDGNLAALAETRMGPALDSALELIAEDRALNRRSITDSDLPATIEPDAGSVVVDLAAGTASLEFCRLGSNIYVEVGGNPDGTDRIIDDQANVYRERADFVLIGPRWLDAGGVVLEVFEGGTECVD